MARVTDVVLDVGLFEDELVRFDGELLDSGRIARSERRDRQPENPDDEQQFPFADEGIEDQDDGSGEEEHGLDDIQRHTRVDVGVAGAKDNTVCGL